MRLFLTLALLLSGSAFAKDLACARSCDDLLKGMAANCRDPGKAEDHHEGGKAAEREATEACQNSMKKLRASCIKQCSTEPKKKR